MPFVYVSDISNTSFVKYLALVTSKCAFVYVSGISNKLSVPFVYVFDISNKLSVSFVKYLALVTS